MMWTVPKPRGALEVGAERDRTTPAFPWKFDRDEFAPGYLFFQTGVRRMKNMNSAKRSNFESN